MDKKKLLQWIDNIIAEDGENLSFGSVVTLGDLKREIENHICESESLQEALNSGDGVYKP